MLRIIVGSIDRPELVESGLSLNSSTVAKVIINIIIVINTIIINIIIIIITTIINIIVIMTMMLGHHQHHCLHWQVKLAGRGTGGAGVRCILSISNWSVTDHQDHDYQDYHDTQSAFQVNVHIAGC